MASPQSRAAFGLDPLWRRALACIAQRRLGAAREVLSAFERAGRGAGVHACILRAQLALFAGRMRDAGEAARAATAAATDDAEACCVATGVALDAGETAVAKTCLDGARLDGCLNPVTLLHAALLRTRLHQAAAALALLEQAHALGHDSPAQLYEHGAALLANGRLDAAAAELTAALTAAPANGRAAVLLTRLRRQTPEHNCLALIDTGARAAPPGSENAAAFEFARYKTLEDLGRFDAAWEALVRANAWMWARVPDTRARHRAALDELIAACAPGRLQVANASSAGPRPIFIIGMPRSGTTLLERMLGNHSAVAMAGELDDFAAQLRRAADARDLQDPATLRRLPGLDYGAIGEAYLAQTRWYAQGRAFYVDKQPTNWMLAPLIHAALPRAPILHLVRDPMDTCFSNFRTYFGSGWTYSYQLDALAAGFNDCRRLMAHWQRTLPGAILDVVYADLVKDPEATLRRVFAFCGLPWEAGCGDPGRNAAPCETVSAVQVRGALRRDTGGQWRRYAQHLQGLAAAVAAPAAPVRRRSVFGADPLWRQAQTHLMQGRFDAARTLLEALRARDTDAVYVPLLVAQIAWGEGRAREGAQAALDAAAVAPDDADALCVVASILTGTGETAAARAVLERIDARSIVQPELLQRLARVHRQLGQDAESLALLEAAAALGAADAGFRSERGEALVHAGQLAAAEVELASALAAAPASGRAAIALVRLRRQTPEHNALAAIERGVGLVPRGSEDHAALEFARYKTFEDLGRYEDAWGALVRGNGLMRARCRDDLASYRTWLERLVEASSSGRLRCTDVAPNGPQPIFIIGMPRSGTTLLERMLGNHSQVAMAGELDDLAAQIRWTANVRDMQSAAFVERVAALDCAELGRRYRAQTQWRARGRKQFVDKQPPNWIFAPLIRAAMPRAPILHLVRDPMDTCFSNWRAYFGGAWTYSYGLDWLGTYFRAYQQVMARWHAAMPGAILDVPYADLVRAPEATLRRVFAFCGLEWEPGCADITRNRAPSGSLSAAQVRAPLNRRGFDVWRHYAEHLAPLRAALAGHSTGAAPSSAG